MNSRRREKGSAWLAMWWELRWCTGHKPLIKVEPVLNFGSAILCKYGLWEVTKLFESISSSVHGEDATSFSEFYKA